MAESGSMVDVIELSELRRLIDTPLGFSSHISPLPWSPAAMP